MYCQLLSSILVRGAYFSGTCLSDTYLSDTYFSDTYLSDTYFSDTYFSDTYLSDTYFIGVCLSDTYCSGAYSLFSGILRSATTAPTHQLFWLVPSWIWEKSKLGRHPEQNKQKAMKTVKYVYPSLANNT